MLLSTFTCSRIVDGNMVCKHCTGACVKNGKLNGRQRYRCKVCQKSFLSSYVYNACKSNMNNYIISLLKEGNGIRSITRLLKISATTVIKRILKIATGIIKPIIAIGKEYEVDELCTYIKRKAKLIWIAYALRRDNKEVVDFSVGSRTNKTLSKVLNTLILSSAQKIYTDKLPHYCYLIPKHIHETRRYNINRIERRNLNLRIHLKRLNRRTICFSKNISVLIACLKIYFWT